MPRIDRTRFIQRHYHPPTGRTRFSPERQLLDPALWSSRVIFKPDGGLIRIRNEGANDNTPINDVFLDDTPCDATDSLISKPSGQVTRLNRDGYNLEDKLRWKHDFYSEVQV
jgi:hypothetical protein